MAFTLTPASPFSAGVSTIPASVANAWRSFFPDALDAGQGGTYANAGEIIIDTGSQPWRWRSLLSIESGGGQLIGQVGSDVRFLSAIRVAGLNNNGSAIPISDNVTLTGTQPAATADPGANNRLTATNITKAWGTIQIVNGTVTVLDGYNLASAVISGGDPTELIITFARVMADTNYGVTFGMRNQASNPRLQAYAGDGTFNTNTFGIHIVDNADGSIKNLTATGTYRFAFEVNGRQ